jgi:hypothetical protein
MKRGSCSALGYVTTVGLKGIAAPVPVWQVLRPSAVASRFIPERRAKSSRNAERHQIGLAGDIIPDSRATSPGISRVGH